VTSTWIISRHERSSASYCAARVLDRDDSYQIWRAAHDQFDSLKICIVKSAPTAEALVDWFVLNDERILDLLNFSNTHGIAVDITDLLMEALTDVKRHALHPSQTRVHSSPGYSRSREVDLLAR
jgi:hypothetical protein